LGDEFFEKTAKLILAKLDALSVTKIPLKIKATGICLFSTKKIKKNKNVVNNKIQ
jgi:hypothetical protein